MGWDGIAIVNMSLMLPCFIGFSSGRVEVNKPPNPMRFIHDWASNQQAGEDRPRRLVERRYMIHEHLVFPSPMIVVATAEVRIIVKGDKEAGRFVRGPAHPR